MNSYYEIALMEVHETAKTVMPSEHKRLEKALEYALTAKVYQVQGAHWQAKNGDGVVYDVDIQHTTCSCMDYANRHKPCKHLLSARLIIRAFEKTKSLIHEDMNPVSVKTPDIAIVNGAHSEAPYSWTMKTQSGQFTIRAMSEDELLQKVNSLVGKL